MKPLPALLAVILFNMAGSVFLAGVYAGGATGYIKYPNGTLVGFIATLKDARLYPGLAVLDASGDGLLFAAKNGLLVYQVGGSVYRVGRLRETLPPYTVGEGYAVIGNKLIYANGTLIEYPQGYSPVGFYKGSLVLDSPRGLILIEPRGGALLYPGVNPVAVCRDSIIVSVNGTVGLLKGDELVVYNVEGYRLAWGGVIDWSIAACIPGGVAFTAEGPRGKSVVIAARNWCKAVEVNPPAKAIGVASNGTLLTIAVQVAGSPKVSISECNASIHRVKVHPLETSPPEARIEELESRGIGVEGLVVHRQEFHPSPVADNVLILAYRIEARGVDTGVAPGGATLPPGARVWPFITLAAFAAILVLLYYSARRRSAESAPQH